MCWERLSLRESAHFHSIWRESFQKQSLCVGIGVFEWNQVKKGLSGFISQKIILPSNLCIQHTWRWIVIHFMNNDTKNSVPVYCKGVGLEFVTGWWLLKGRNAPQWWLWGQALPWTREARLELSEHKNVAEILCGNWNICESSLVSMNL